MLGRGNSVYCTVVYSGRVSHGLGRTMEAVVGLFHTQFRCGKFHLKIELVSENCAELAAKNYLQLANLKKNEKIR